jgi:hypothetical protein
LQGKSKNSPGFHNEFGEVRKGSVKFPAGDILMEAKTLRAHFDGSQILLDEPFELEPNAELIVTVLPTSSDDEREDWARLSLESLARTYGDDEPEYSLDLIKEANPAYEGKVM